MDATGKPPPQQNFTGGRRNNFLDGTTVVATAQRQLRPSASINFMRGKFSRGGEKYP